MISKNYSVPTSPQTSAVNKKKGVGTLTHHATLALDSLTMCNKQSPRQNDIAFPLGDYKSSDAGVLAHYLHGSNCPDSSSR